MNSFDFDSVSDYALEKLEPYIKNPNFNPEHCQRFWILSAILCKWCIYVYEICSIKSTVYIEIMKFILKIKLRKVLIN